MYERAIVTSFPIDSATFDATYAGGQGSAIATSPPATLGNGGVVFSDASVAIVGAQTVASTNTSLIVPVDVMGNIIPQAWAPGPQGMFNAAVVDSMGRIVIVGNRAGTSTTPAVYRYQKSGSTFVLDPTFAQSGTYALGSSMSTAQAVALDRIGRIVVVGASSTNATYVTRLWP